MHTAQRSVMYYTLVKPHEQQGIVIIFNKLQCLTFILKYSPKSVNLDDNHNFLIFTVHCLQCKML